MNAQSRESENKLLKKKQVADLLGVSLRSVERLVSLGRLTRVRILGAIRFRLSEVQNIINGGSA